MVYKFFNKKSASLVNKSISGGGVKSLYQINNLRMNFINQLLRNLKKEKHIHHLSTTFMLSI